MYENKCDGEEEEKFTHWMEKLTIEEKVDGEVKKQTGWRRTLNRTHTHIHTQWMDEVNK